MAYKNKFTTLILAVAAFGAVASESHIAPRLSGGAPIDTLRRFPHHVTISRLWTQNIAPCGGTILGDQWILTSAECVRNSQGIRLQFERLYKHKMIRSYSAEVNSDEFHLYPTYYDNIALVKIPFRLVFSDTIQPIKISSMPPDQLENNLMVLPGFDDNDTTQDGQLTYAMLKIQPINMCKSIHNFDEYLQFCTKGWANNKNTPCNSDSGSGLISGWPASSQLLGIYIDSLQNCESSNPGVFLNVLKYTSWIESVMNNN